MFLNSSTSFIIIQQWQKKYINIVVFGAWTGISIRPGGSEIRGCLTLISSDFFQAMHWSPVPIYQLYLGRNWFQILYGLHTCSCQWGHCCKMLCSFCLWTFIWMWRIISVGVSEIRRRGLLCALSPAILWLQFLVNQKSGRGSDRQEYC